MSPSAASTPWSQFWVARYSVKMMTRSLDHLPPGRMCSLSQRISRLGLGVELRAMACSAQAFISLSSASSSAIGSLEEQAGGIEGLVGRLFGLVVDGVLFVHPVDLPLEDAAGGLGDDPCASWRFASEISCCSSVRRKAAGLEKSRFLRVISTKSVANLSACSSQLACRSSAYLLQGGMDAPSLRPGNRLPGLRAPAWGIGPGRSRPWAVPT